MNLNELLKQSVSQWPEKPAVIEGETIISYTTLAAIISDFERRLKSLALPPGSRVGLGVPTDVNYIALTYALWRVQAIVIPIPVEYPADEFTQIAVQMQLE